ELFFAMQRMGNRMAPDYVGNPELKATRNSQADLGIKYYNGKLMLRANSFYAYLYDYIIPVEISKNTGDLSPRDTNELAAYKAWTGQDASVGNRYARSYKNIRAVMYGGELESMLSLPGLWYLGVGAGYTRGINDSDDRELPEIAPLKGTARIKFDNNTWMAELEGEFAATQNKIDDRIGETNTAGWGIANLKGSYHKDGIKLLLQVRNLFDRAYYEHLSYSRQFYTSGAHIPEPGRTITLSLQWQF
ncbi:MAG: TonB-dependent receptor, partial [Leptospiraceae bacterium]|nr:TonB-dependent receptor [Leptospiraceae bacterium]